MRPLSFHPEAELEYTQAARYYMEVDPILGARFYEEIERLIADVRSQPELYRMYEAPIRRHFSHLFPYALLYVDQPDRIRLLAVMHMKRKPGYWRSRK